MSQYIDFEIELPDELVEELYLLANSCKMSIDEICELILEEYVSQYKKNEKRIKND